MHENVIITVSDGTDSITQSFTVTVAEPNHAPVITSTAVTTGTAGTAYTYTVTATDPDGDTLTYSLTTNPTGMTINSATGVITWTPTAAGSENVIITVSDGTDSITQSFTITVAEALNQAPVITPITDYTLTLGGTFSYTVTATDPDGDTLTYSLSTYPTGMTIDSATGVITWIPTSVVSYSVTIEVSDGDLTDVQTFTVTVLEIPNKAPVISPIADATIILGETFSYTATATDPDGDTLTYSLTTNPTGMTINSTTGAITWIPTSVVSYSVTVEVSDGELTDTQSFTITVGEILLTSIEVLPYSMTLEVGDSRTIDSITTHYNNGTETIITPLSTCTYESDKSNATVSSDGVITGISSCTASTPVTITVTYTEDSITKTDTISVVVTNSSPG